MKSLVSLFLSICFAAAAGASIDDFNELIQDSQKSEVELRAKLQLDSGSRLKDSEVGTIARDSIEAPTTAEQIATSSSSSISSARQKKMATPDSKAEAQRISQELKELN